jgi:hypothetical protein
MPPAATPADKRPGLDDTVAAWIRLALRARCCELSLYLIRGEQAPALLDEIVDMACDSWALRDGDDA